MTAIGLAIMIVAGIVTVDVVLENTRNTEASVVGQTIANVDLGGFFTAGVLVGVALMLGLMLLLAGLRRARRKRLERKELTRSYEGTAAQAESLQEERDRLAAELESERRARANERDNQGAVREADRDRDYDGDDDLAASHGHGTVPTAATTDTRTRPANEAPVYPGDPVGTGATPAAATATQQHTTQQQPGEDQRKPSIKDRLLGR
jgi:cytoskeletal protein RodZ